MNCTRTAALSADGRFVVFESEAANLVAGVTDRNQGVDVFLWNRATGRTDLVSHRAGNPTATGNHDSFTTPFVSTDGAYVVFGSRSSNLVPGQSGSGQNVYLWERASSRTTLVSHTASIFVWDRATGMGSPVAANRETLGLSLDASGTTRLVSHDIRGDTFAAGGVRSSGPSASPLLAASGSAVAFTSAAPDLVPRDFNDQLDAFVAPLP